MKFKVLGLCLIMFAQGQFSIALNFSTYRPSDDRLNFSKIISLNKNDNISASLKNYKKYITILSGEKKIEIIFLHDYSESELVNIYVCLD